MSKRNYHTEWDQEKKILTKQFNDEQETTVSVSFDDLPQNARDYIVEYGMKQVLNDCHAGAKSVEEMIQSTQQKAQDLSDGVLRRAGGGGLGLGVNLDKLTQALANVKFAGDLDAAKSALAPFIPGEDDDEETEKQKKARLRSIRNMGVIKTEVDKLDGKDVGSLLDEPLT